MIKRFLCNRDGGTAVEYALIASIILFAIILAVMPIGGELNNVFSGASYALDGAQ